MELSHLWQEINLIGEEIWCGGARLTKVGCVTLRIDRSRMISNACFDINVNLVLVLRPRG